MNNVKLSIIVPVYNVELYIERCITSLIDERYENYEIIIVNDGTKDASIAKIMPLISKSRMITLINQSNQGLSEARNTGLKNAKGDYIVFVDSDDWVKQGYLDNIYCELIDHPELVVFSYTNVNITTGVSTPCLIDSRKYDRKHIKNAIVDLDINGYYLSLAWNKVYKRSLIDGICFEAGLSYCEDIVFNCEVFAKVQNIKTSDKSYYCYRTSESSLTNNRFYSNYAELANKAIASRTKLYTTYNLHETNENLLMRKNLEYKLGEVANLYREKSDVKRADRIKTISRIKKEIAADKAMVITGNKKERLILSTINSLPEALSDSVLISLFTVKNSRIKNKSIELGES
jgi:glycosyltransferase involved in cell wall biosynthesis